MVRGLKRIEEVNLKLLECERAGARLRRPSSTPFPTRAHKGEPKAKPTAPAGRSTSRNTRGNEVKTERILDKFYQNYPKMLFGIRPTL